MDATSAVKGGVGVPPAPIARRAVGWLPPSALRTAATALLVAAAYYLGAQIGFVLKFPHATPSVLWPPNAILTATLLLAPTRRWWIYLLAALPAHLLVELGAAWPAPLVLALFVTNCSEALLAAGGVRRFSDRPARFDTLRRAAMFVVCAGLVAPYLSSFLDAAAVAGVRGEPYWLVWRTRFFSNVLTELTLVPALVMTITAGQAWLRDSSFRRQVEAALLAGGLLLVGVVVFAGPVTDSRALSGLLRTPAAFLLPFLLPFLLWAAVRFGPGGASLSLLTTTLLAIWAGTQGLGPFAALAPAESVQALQIFLSIGAIPLLCLAAVVEERRQAKEALEERLRFEELLSRLSGAFVHLPAHEVDQAIRTWLGRLGRFLGLDRLALLRLSDDGRDLAVAHSWTAQEFAPMPLIVGRKDFPWAMEQLRREEPVVVSRLDDLPGEAARDRESLRRHGVRSNLTLPLVAGGRVFGGLALSTIAAERSWPIPLTHRLQLVTEVFANALACQQMQDALRAGETMKSDILASLPASVAVLDREGRIIAVNRAWTRFARENGATSDARIGVGVNYLDACRRAAGQEPSVEEVVAGIQAVLDGSRTGFALEYGCDPVGSKHPLRDQRWFAMSVVPLHRVEGGAVVSHTEITDRRHAEMEAQRSRQDLAHFTRVSTMGELVASLAHELNQPLTAILSNAQAARRFLNATSPDLGELDGILSDIVEDDKRAGEVIRRLRQLLRRGEFQPSVLDLNALIREVIVLVSSDALIRKVSLVLDFDPQAPLVSGDRVQLQQVVLNLMLNAMEAMAECGAGERTVVVRTRNTEVKTAQVSVEDAGTGLSDGARDLIFEPFYTTKPAGMGMGLSIARSIIEAHGGAIWATSNPARGATFHFTLPLSDEMSV